MTAETHPDIRCVWCGPSLLVTDTAGWCEPTRPFGGYFVHEARHLSRLQLHVHGETPWCCALGTTDHDRLEGSYVYPEMTRFGGGGTGLSDDDIAANAIGIEYRSVDLRLTYRLHPDRLEAVLVLTNRSADAVELELAWLVAADFADLQEVQGGERRQEGCVMAEPDGASLVLRYARPDLPLETRIAVGGAGDWAAAADRIVARLSLASQQTGTVQLEVLAIDGASPLSVDADRRERCVAEWQRRAARVEVPADRRLEEAVNGSVRSLGSLALLAGGPDEWLTPAAGMPFYPALFGRDALTAGWQVAMMDRGEMIDAALGRLGALQGTHVLDANDEAPGRIVQQARTGPLARLGQTPFGRYYGDFASPLMYVVSLAHLYSWTGDRAMLARHWDTARRAMDWARDYGDRDGDGYLEYVTRSPDGPKHQGWKDSGRAILDETGRTLSTPIAAAEVQGYRHAALQLMAALHAVRGETTDAQASWHAAAELKRRFNEDFWIADEQCLAMALDADKRPARSVGSNAAQCIPTGIVSDEHLPPLVGRLFAPDSFSGWGIRTLSTAHPAYNPTSYHLGSVWPVENATTAFGLRRYGFDVRALDLVRSILDLALLYEGGRIPECVGGYARGDGGHPGAYPRANPVQAWNLSAFPLLVHTVLGLQPVAPLDLLVVDPVLPTWLPEIVVRDLRLAGARATIRFYRDRNGTSRFEVLEQRGTLRVLRQPPPEALGVGVRDRFTALVDGVLRG